MKVLTQHHWTSDQLLTGFIFGGLTLGGLLGWVTGMAIGNIGVVTSIGAFVGWFVGMLIGMFMSENI